MTAPSFTDRLTAAHQVGDPAADALVAAFRALPGRAGWALLDEALTTGVTPAGAPDELDALLAPLREPPDWLDLDRVDAGAVALWRIGAPTIGLALTYGSLAFGYQSADLVRPLAATGRLEKLAPRRLAETVKWALEVTTPGGLAVGATGWRMTVRVRLVHALVRRHLLDAGTWDPAWGVPISAAGGFATAIGGFYVIPMRAMHDLGVRLSPAEDEAIAHLWKWVGHLMGVPADLLPDGAQQSRDWMDLAMEQNAGPTEDSPKLMHALLHHGFDGLFPAPVAAPIQFGLARVMAGFARRWMGDDMADALEVPTLTGARLVPLLRPATRARGLLRVIGDERLAALEIALVRRMISRPGVPADTLNPADAADAPVLRAA